GLPAAPRAGARRADAPAGPHPEAAGAQPAAPHRRHRRAGRGQEDPPGSIIMSVKVLERLKERFADAIVATHSNFGDDTALVARERILEVLTFLRDDVDLQFNLSSSVTGVDYYGREPRFEVVWHLY